MFNQFLTPNLLAGLFNLSNRIVLCVGFPQGESMHAILVYETCTTLSNGYLGFRNDEERSEMRYVMRIADFCESSNL